MSTDSESGYDGDDGGGNDPNGQQAGAFQNDLRELRKKAKQADELAKKVAQYERDNAFRDAGINPTDPKAKYFVKGYDGELTADAIKAEATAAGFIQTDEQRQAATAQQQQAEQQRVNQEAAHGRMDGASQGAGTQSPDAQAELVAKMAAATSMDELVSIATSAGMPTTLNRE